MEVLCFQHAVPSGLERTLQEFEEQFSYPLGEGESFHVSHGGRYLNFFHAMGQASLCVAMRREQVLGTLVGVRRPMRLADGRVVAATYVCDLKVASGGFVAGFCWAWAGPWRRCGGRPVGPRVWSGDAGDRASAQCLHRERPASRIHERGGSGDFQIASSRSRDAG